MMLKMEKKMTAVTASQERESDTDTNRGGTTAPQFHRLPCVAHSLQLVIIAVDKQPSFNTIKGKAHNIVRNIRVSSVATQKLVSKCGKTVVADCPTRWSSTLLMLNRLLECKLESWQWERKNV